MTALHEQDFYAWTNQQAQFLKTGCLSKLDVDFLIEELESMGQVKNVNYSVVWKFY